MIDIAEVKTGEDLAVRQAAAPKAGNVLSVQLGDLEYEPEFGVDLKYFLTSEFDFQNASFQSYLVQRLTQHQVNVTQVISLVQSVYEKYTYAVTGASENNGGLLG